MTEWQFYWPDWWRLWPFVSIGEPDEDFGARQVIFCFGPLQVRWYE